MHMPGTSNKAADAASRHPSPSISVNTLGVNDQMEHALAAVIQREAAEISSLPWSRIVEETAKNDHMRALMQTVESGFPKSDKDHQHAAPYWQFRESMYVSDGVVMFEDHVVIPPSLRPTVLSNLHAAHQGPRCTCCLCRLQQERPIATVDAGNPIFAPFDPLRPPSNLSMQTSSISQGDIT